MGWEKKGLVFSPNGQYPWVMTHGMLPVADRVGEDLYRIYFSGRDVSNRSRIGYVEIDMTEPNRVLHLSEHPVLDLGKLGCFDDNGVTPTWIVTREGRKYLYYFGWNKGSTVRAAEVSGLAISEDGGETFARYSAAPIIDRTNAEPYTVLVISCILIENGVWRMWYDSADRWISTDLPQYNIKYAESPDGIRWQRAGTVSVDYKYPGESRVSRASIVKESGIYRMWYCYAIGAGGYKMGYSESKDGFQFCRMDDKAGIDMSESGWDSEMICYPYVFDHKGKRIMLYCGNGYGKTGFGYALFNKDI